jgi:hypothetical protein
MSGVFQDVRLEWRSRPYTIPAQKIMGAIAVIERHITLKELGEAARDRGTVPLSALASAWAALIRYAGAEDVFDDEIYQEMFAGSASNTIIAAIEGLMAMMIPPSKLASAPAGNQNRRSRRKAAAAARSSQKHSS